MSTWQEPVPASERHRIGTDLATRAAMPTYDYGCPACGHRFELFEGITASGPRECPGCGKKKARRLISAGSGLIFKGAGFYTTDYARKPENASTAKK